MLKLNLFFNMGIKWLHITLKLCLWTTEFNYESAALPCVVAVTVIALAVLNKHRNRMVWVWGTFSVPQNTTLKTEAAFKASFFLPDSQHFSMSYSPKKTLRKNLRILLPSEVCPSFKLEERHPASSSRWYYWHTLAVGYYSLCSNKRHLVHGIHLPCHTESNLFVSVKLSSFVPPLTDSLPNRSVAPTTVPWGRQW